MEDAVYDLQRLILFHQALDALDVRTAPTAQVLFPAPPPPARRVGVLCGSFNPLTLAHTELAERARVVAGLDLVIFTLAKVTVDKEHVTGLSLEDRLLLLSLYAQRHSLTGVALVNRGLYFEQAQAFRSLLGAKVKLSFIVGMDKLLQILDPKYYQDRDAALRQLFTLTSLIVANRGEMARAELQQVLERPENHPYRSHIQFCPLSSAIAEVSATAVRKGLREGARVDEFLPAETSFFLKETQAFHPPLRQGNQTIHAYAVRQHLLNLLLVAGSHTHATTNLQSLLQAALQEGKAGEALRNAVSPDDLR